MNLIKSDTYHEERKICVENSSRAKIYIQMITGKSFKKELENT